MIQSMAFIKNLHTRLQASAVHLLICVLIAALAAALIFFVWYPNPLQAAVGANKLFWLILTIDVILGPLLTLVVFNPAKKSLKFDLAVIAFVQMAALTYGMHTMYQGKPAYIALNKDRFFLASVHEIKPEWYARSSTNANFRLSDKWFSPQFAAVQWPQDVQAQNDLLFSNSSARVDAYIPIEQAADLIRLVAKPFADLSQHNRGREQELAQLQARWIGKGITNLGFIPLRAEQEDMAVLVDTAAGKVLEIVRFAPWQ
jgi:hypothetical protein